MDTDKASARTRLHNVLRVTSPEQRAAWSAQIRAHLEASALWRSARKVMLFAALRYEPDLLPLLEATKQFAFPSLEADRIVPREVAHEHDLRLSVFGIREPDPDRCPIAENLDLVLVPGLGLGRDGSRLGRGRGHYDWFLAGLPADTVRCGVCFACQISERVPSEEHDVTMQAVLSEEGLVPV